MLCHICSTSTSACPPDICQTSAFFLSADGTFSFGQEDDLSHLEVEGTPVRAPSQSSSPPRHAQPLTLSATSSASTPRSYPTFSSVVSQSGNRRGGSTRFSLKVVHACITEFSNNRPNFHRLRQTFIEMTESTANVLHNTAAAQREFGFLYKCTHQVGLLLAAAHSIKINPHM